MSCTNRVSARPGPQGRRSARGDQHRDSLHCRAAKRPQWLGGRLRSSSVETPDRGRSAPHRQAPRTPIGAGGGGGASRSGSGSITTTDALGAESPAQTEHAVAGLATVGSSLDRREIAASGLVSLSGVGIRPARHPEPRRNVVRPRRQRLPKSLPQLNIRHTAAQTRRVSTAQFEPDPRMLRR